ncbi:helix-turn-helix domain-containing protein [Rhodovulum sulfidophilum]|uniref:helix-turn-helix domain-containing protein n=1 Tax=Rhodovulum sulfidophilum TaxID=35806 RepID=UPI0019240A1B|nr:helix-turn-helix transcriptional regulator [Rhodovulum sulfidophilum]MBL3575602.1 helix-turn-helix transcriptional regulator [Rhodovulum sulfidophilum]MCE8431769.1 helix-turn-helix domain-containing protein [Rhodovulum sulfidophilum]MCF4115289.1 helix-turn-helix domain-containing protein [Rhodovulum sulfidophilum]
MSKFRFKPQAPETAEDQGPDVFAERQELERSLKRSNYAIDKGLLRLRKQWRLSQTQMGKLMGVSLRTYRFYEQGERSVPSEAVKELLITTDCDLEELFTGKPSVVAPEKAEALLQHYDRVQDELLSIHSNLKIDEVRRLARVYIAVSDAEQPIDLTKVSYIYDAMFRGDSGDFE